MSIARNFLILASTLTLLTSAHAANIDAECRASAGRLSPQYAPLHQQKAATAPDRRARIDAAVNAAYGGKKADADAKLPGMVAWSTGVLEKALLFNWAPAKFAQEAYADCLMKFEPDAGA